LNNMKGVIDVARRLQVILNADDFGLTEGVSEGIVRAIQGGALTTTSAMACAPGALARLLRWAKEVPGCVGAHLQLTTGVPVLGGAYVPSLVQSNGCFPNSRKTIASPRADDVRCEWHAQIQVLRSLGIRITHLDSHHHVHGLPSVFPVFCEIAMHYRLPARPLDRAMATRFRALGIPCVDECLLDWYGGDLSVQSLLSVITRGASSHGDSCLLEVMCHPGLVDESLATVSRYVDDRLRELEVLRNHELLEALSNRACQAVRFSSVEWLKRSSEVVHA